MVYPKWKERPVIPALSKEVRDEMLALGMDLYDVVYILENGYDCPIGKRRGVIEKCIRKGPKVIKVVVAASQLRWPDGFIEDCWKLIHVGKAGFDGYE